MEVIFFFYQIIPGKRRRRKGHLFTVSCLQWQSWLAEATLLSENLSAQKWMHSQPEEAGWHWVGCAEFGLAAADFLGVCSQLPLTAQPEQQDVPPGRRGTGSNKKRLPSSGMPLANAQSQKNEMDQMRPRLAGEQKIRHAGQNPCRPVAKAAAQASEGILGASRICVKYSHPVVWLQGERGCGCKLLPAPEKEVTDPGPHPQQLLSFFFFVFLFFFHILYRIRKTRQTELRRLNVLSLCLTVVVTMVAACSLRHHVWSCNLLSHALLYRSYTVGSLKRHFFLFLYCGNTFSIAAESRKPGHDFKIVVQTLSRSHIFKSTYSFSLSWGC